VNEPWRHQAACAGMDTDFWFPDRPVYSPDHKRAVTVCRICVVQLACLRTAIETPENHGIWGGLSPKQRIALRQDRHAYRALIGPEAV